MSEYTAPWTDNDGNLKANAYHYSFDFTGVEAIDIILSAVALAGKMAHHTESWGDHAWKCGCDDQSMYETCPESPVGLIEAAAREAARRWQEMSS